MKKAKYWDKVSMVDVELLTVDANTGNCVIVMDDGQVKIVAKKDLTCTPDTS